MEFFCRGGIYPVWYSLIFLDGRFVVRCQFWKALGQYFFKYFFCSILYTSYTPLIGMLHLWTLLSNSWMFFFLLLLFLKSFFFLLFVFQSIAFLLIFLIHHWFFLAMLSLPINSLKSFFISITVYLISSIDFFQLFHSLSITFWFFHSFSSFCLHYLPVHICLLFALDPLPC